MTSKKDLKELIRRRMAKTGEPYTVARRQVLAAAGKVCPACKADLKTRVVRTLADFDEDGDTEGQIADQMAAEESGDWGEWAIEVEEVFCPSCETPTGRVFAQLGVPSGRRRK